MLVHRGGYLNGVEGINHCEMGSPQVAEKKIALEIVEPII